MHEHDPAEEDPPNATLVCTYNGQTEYLLTGPESMMSADILIDTLRLFAPPEALQPDVDYAEYLSAVDGAGPYQIAIGATLLPDGSIEVRGKDLTGDDGMFFARLLAITAVLSRGTLTNEVLRHVLTHEGCSHHE